MPHQNRALFTEGLDDPGDIGSGGGRVVAAWSLVATAITTQVHRHRPETGLRDPRKLMPPRPPEFREAVQQEDQWALPGLADVELTAVGRDSTLGPGTGRDEWVTDAERAHSGGLGRSACFVICVAALVRASLCMREIRDLASRPSTPATTSRNTPATRKASHRHSPAASSPKPKPMSRRKVEKNASTAAPIPKIPTEVASFLSASASALASAI